MPRSSAKAASLLGCTGLLAAAALTAGVGSASAAGATTVSYPGSVPSWASHANDDGAPTDDPIVEGEIFLDLQDYAGAKAEALAVSTPGNALYRKYMTPAAWISKYAPTAADYKEVTDYVKSQGFTIPQSPEDREYVVFRGAESKVYGAFGTKLHTYSFQGKKLLAPSSAPTLPTALAKLVTGVSLDQGMSLTRPTNIKLDGKTTPGTARKASPQAKAATALPSTPCSSYWGQNGATLPTAYGRKDFPTYICGYSASQISGAYGLTKLQTSGIDGKGQTIAIVDAYSSPTIVKDSQTVEAQTGTTLLKSSQFTNVTPRQSYWDDEDLCTGPSGWQGEEAIDVQIAHGIAPGANIVYSGGIDCEGGLDLGVSKILDRKLATIVSNSYGDLGESLPENTLVGEESKEFQAAAEGIGLYFSSGDDGDEFADLGFTSPSFEASSPYVTAVGGTSLAISPNNGYDFETGWGSTRDQVVSTDSGLAYAEKLPGTAFRGGVGGGVSTQFDEPAYQKGVEPKATGRLVPDVAALADPYTGFSIGISQINDDSTLSTDPFTTETYGGTSLASPLFAAQVALAQQETGSEVGFANPTLYSLSGSSYHDVVPYNPTKAVAFTNVLGNLYLVTLDRDTSLSTAKGYDLVTGLGSPTPSGLKALGSAK